MPQSLAKILLHIVVSTKDRYPFLTEKVRSELHAYATTVLQGMDTPLIAINSMPDHLHVWCLLSRQASVADVVERLKTSTSRWIKGKGGMLQKFYWQRGYGVFSVSPSNAEGVKAYVLGQDAHLRGMDFKDEWLALLRKNGIEFDERYVWD